MAITTKDVEHVAKLARLALSDDEKERFAEQLGRIIESFNELSSVDTDQIEPFTHALPLLNVMREDELRPLLGSETLLQGAPDKEGSFFRVPKIGD
ncbi:MAG: Asp-tRNA(Asn)/Glu-tRNA(Gln) amidotransferase subunit GatC [Candidatus Obscuribacterales bacterium]|nr:Asp-tRNA(Asn)/Glu-tRNA(Gln) amidotransferase subunit GatC [Candidatus Obscuribacterales bacterium]